MSLFVEQFELMKRDSEAFEGQDGADAEADKRLKVEGDAPVEAPASKGGNWDKGPDPVAAAPPPMPSQGGEGGQPPPAPANQGQGQGYGQGQGQGQGQEDASNGKVEVAFRMVAPNSRTGVVIGTGG